VVIETFIYQGSHDSLASRDILSPGGTTLTQLAPPVSRVVQWKLQPRILWHGFGCGWGDSDVFLVAFLVSLFSLFTDSVTISHIVSIPLLLKAATLSFAIFIICN
jgi:hypothetical protein